MLSLMGMQRPCCCQQWANYASPPTIMVAKHNSWHLPLQARTTAIENPTRDGFSASFHPLDLHHSMTRLGSASATLQLLLRGRITLQLSDLIHDQVGGQVGEMVGSQGRSQRYALPADPAHPRCAHPGGKKSERREPSSHLDALRSVGDDTEM